MVYEFGHSFTGLADEYESAYPGYPDCNDRGSGSPCEANVTNQTNAASIKWAPLLSPGIAIPTPAGRAGTGLFVGARYRESGMYRPTYDMCLMRSNTNVFCPVCAAEFVRKLYAGGFGTPSAGIDLIEPGSESPGNANTVIYTAGSTQVFSASVLAPGHGEVSRRWWLDGEPIPDATSSSYAFTQTSATPTTHTLELRVHDDTPLVPAAMAGQLLEHKRTWTIQVQPAASFQINQGITGSWFNPETNGQGMLIDLLPDPKFMFVGWFTYEKAQSPTVAASADRKVGSPEHRWMTASGSWTGNVARLILYASSGGVFNNDAPVTSTAVGTLTLTFDNCASATAVYNIPGESQSGTIPLSRSATLGMAQVCQSLNARPAATGTSE